MKFEDWSVRNRIKFIYIIAIVATIATIVLQAGHLEKGYKEAELLLNIEAKNAFNDAYKKLMLKRFSQSIEEEIEKSHKNKKDNESASFEKDQEVNEQSNISVSFNSKSYKDLDSAKMFIRGLYDDEVYKLFEKEGRAEELDMIKKIYSNIAMSVTPVFSIPEYEELGEFFHEAMQDREIELPFSICYLRKDSLVYTYGQDLESLELPIDPLLSKTLEDEGKAKAVVSTEAGSRAESVYESDNEEEITRPDKKLTMSLYLGNPYWYLLKKLWINLLFSLLQKGIIISVFLYLTNVVLKQKQMSQIRTDFINSMTHEFKTPISTISAAMEAMENFNALQDVERSKRYIQISRGELKRLSSMIEKVLTISVWEKKGVKLSLSTIDLSELIRNTQEKAILSCNKEINIDLNIPESCCVTGDRLHLQNVIGNLLDNAIKYSNDQLDVMINLSQNNDSVELKVKDNGIGIDDKHVKHIFDDFYRVPTGNLYQVKGFGLGLSYVKKVIMAHGGNIKVKSKMGKGSEFTIKLPFDFRDKDKNRKYLL